MSTHFKASVIAVHYSAADQSQAINLILVNHLNGDFIASA